MYSKLRQHVRQRNTPTSAACRSVYLLFTPVCYVGSETGLQVIEIDETIHLDVYI